MTRLTNSKTFFQIFPSRELQFKVKGISMSVFTAEDVAEVAAIGNTKHNDIYMAKYSRETVLPNGSDVGKLREFIKTKYTEKKWYQNGSSGNDSNSSSAIPAEHSSSDSSDLWGKKQSSTSRMPVLTKVRSHGGSAQINHFSPAFR